jgi:hypothetical protein
METNGEPILLLAGQGVTIPPGTRRRFCNHSAGASGGLSAPTAQAQDEKFPSVRSLQDGPVSPAEIEPATSSLQKIAKIRCEIAGRMNAQYVHTSRSAAMGSTFVARQAGI